MPCRSSPRCGEHLWDRIRDMVLEDAELEEARQRIPGAASNEPGAKGADGPAGCRADGDE